MDPFICKSINAVDRYPELFSLTDNVLTPEEVATVCFPSGMKIRMIPRYVMDKGAKGLIGEENDIYQIHTVRMRYSFLIVKNS